MPDQVKVSAFSVDGDANVARQNPDLPPCPLLSFITSDSIRTGLASGAQKRAGGIIFCKAIRPVSNWLAAGCLEESCADSFPEGLLQPSSSATANDKKNEIALFILTIYPIIRRRFPTSGPTPADRRASVWHLRAPVSWRRFPPAVCGCPRRIFPDHEAWFPHRHNRRPREAWPLAQRHPIRAVAV